jgi:hypothetical protein
MTADARDAIARCYGQEVIRLVDAATTTEGSYYPAIRTLLADVLESRDLPFQVRTATSEQRAGGGADHPDVAIYDGAGDFIAVAGEVKLPGTSLRELALSTERNDQLGRYLAQTGVVLISNVHEFGVVAVRPGATRDAGRPVPPADRDLLEVVSLWASEQTFRDGRPMPTESVQALADLLERAVTEFVPIAEPETLARVLAMQARRAKADLPERFDAVQGLLEDYGVALGITFEGAEGLEFFRSSLIQTAYYGLFAGWALWHRENDGTAFEWERLDRYLKIPFLGKLFYEFRHPDRLEELHLARHLDRATETLHRVDLGSFFKKFHAPSLNEELGREETAAPDLSAAAITYFYEPFLEAFDPDLRKELGVWYTPPEIVRYQVQKIDALLRKELGCSRGLADENVVVLDPCCGTGAYLIDVIRCIVRQLHGEGEDASLGAQVLDAVCSRVIGFEILTAPFVIAQLQIYLLLADLDALPGKGQRPAVFLTNALSGWDGPEPIKLNFPELQREHDAAEKVKRGSKIIVILGNPPYNRFAGAAIKEEADLVDHYKGIARNDKGRQVGQSVLFTKWGIRKHLLDDLYIRFIRLAEKRIGEVAEYGIVSFISNSSFLTGRSHPLMRESLLRNFHQIWVDNLHGNRIASERTPWGESCETMFSTEAGAGIKVGTCITTHLKRKGTVTVPEKTRVFHRDFWGRAADKRRALLESLDLDSWPAKRRKAAADCPEGPRTYEPVAPTAANRWMLSPRDVNTGFEAWPALDEIFPVSFQGVNPNRGLDGSLIDIDREALESRMRAYYSAKRFKDIQAIAPALCEPRARYDPETTWKRLQAESRFDAKRIVQYLLFPLDLRWVYYESEAKLLNERRPEFWDALDGNEFLVAVPQPRRASETRPLLASTLVDLHLHDRGSVCFPQRVKTGAAKDGTLFKNSRAREYANIAAPTWEAIRTARKLRGDLDGKDAKKLVRDLFRVALAILHTPQYEEDHRDGIAQDWAHLPIPKDRQVFARLVEIGEKVAVLLDPAAKADAEVQRVLGAAARSIGVLAKVGSSKVSQEDLRVRVSYYGAAKGKWQEREYREGESANPGWGPTTGDLFINDRAFFSNVPSAIWRYELGGYPVLKKLMGYRQASRRDGKPLTLSEARHFRSMIQRLAAALVLREDLGKLYEAASADAFTAEELGLR